MNIRYINNSIQTHIMKEIVAVVVFCFILFIYLHVHFHLKKVDDLEIYELCQPSKEKLEEICDFRQPVVTDFNNQSIIEKCNLNYIKANYTGYDIKIRNVKERDDDTELYIPLGIVESIDLFKKDKESKYMSENNHDFLDETGLVKLYRNNDMYLRPSMVSSCNYDLIFGSLNVETPLRHEINYRNYFLVTHGKAIVRLLVPKSKKYLYGTNDYDNFEFISPVNPWNVQDEYQADFNKLRTIDVNLVTGQMIHIPAYWWYSIKFVKSNTTICVFKYKTYMNTLAVSNHLIMRLLQCQNTKRIVAKKMSLFENKKGKNNEQNTDYVSINIPPTISTLQQLESNDEVKISIPMPMPMPTSVIAASATSSDEPAIYENEQLSHSNHTNSKSQNEPDVVINL